ncbi:hypothetical protein Pan258_45190 [Symmachiella dynata]|nr:hypothetical protein Pan258_45190 [Symmachiella dynata]
MQYFHQLTRNQLISKRFVSKKRSRVIAQAGSARQLLLKENYCEKCKKNLRIFTKTVS